MSIVTVGSTQIENWRYGDGTAYLRAYANVGFLPAGGGEFVMFGKLGSGKWCKQIPCTAEGGVLSVPSFEIESTTDSPTNPRATYTFVFADSRGKEVEIWAATFAIEASPAITTWQILRTQNAAAPGSRPSIYYTVPQTEERIAQAVDVGNPATVDDLGRVAVSYPPVDPARPKAVGDNDPRLSSMAAAATADLPAAGTAGRLRRVLDGPRGFVFDTGTRWVNALMGNICVEEYATLSAMVADIGATARTVYVPASYSVANSPTLPSNITLKFTGSGKLDVASGQTVTIQGAVVAPCRQIFTGAGTVNITGPVEIEPAWYSTAGDGSTAAPFTGWGSRVPWGSWSYLLSAAEYAYATAPNWAYRNIRIKGAGIGRTILRHTGSGNAVHFTSDAVTNDTMPVGAQLLDLDIIGNASTTNGLYVQRSQHMEVWVRMREVPCGLRTGGLVVGGHFFIVMSGNETPYTVKPDPFVRLNDTYKITLDVYLEGNSGLGFEAKTGVLLESNANYNDIRGVSEGIGIGLQINDGCHGNNVSEFYTEACQIYNVLCNGQYNTFRDNTSAHGGVPLGGTGLFHFGATAKGNRVDGGLFYKITTAVGSDGNVTWGANLNYQGIAYPGFEDLGANNAFLECGSFSNSGAPAGALGTYDGSQLSNATPRNQIVRRNVAASISQFIVQGLNASGAARFALWDALGDERARFAYDNTSNTCYAGTSEVLAPKTPTDFVLGANGVPMLVLGVLGEAAFIRQYAASLVDAGNSGAAKTINWRSGNVQLVTLTGNCTFTFSNPISGARYVLIVKQDGTGSRTATWPGAVLWSGGTAPTLTTAAGKVDILTLVYDGVSGKYYGGSAANY